MLFELTDDMSCMYLVIASDQQQFCLKKQHQTT